MDEHGIVRWFTSFIHGDFPVRKLWNGQRNVEKEVESLPDCHVFPKAFTAAHRSTSKSKEAKKKTHHQQVDWTVPQLQLSQDSKS
jgi:hypothetical protein